MPELFHGKRTDMSAFMLHLERGLVVVEGDVKSVIVVGIFPFSYFVDLNYPSLKEGDSCFNEDCLRLCYEGFEDFLAFFIEVLGFEDEC